MAEGSNSELRLPEFIMAGAMKCGTTTLHMVLDRHPGIFIPRSEIGFYDADDLRQHPDFHISHAGHWYYPKLDEERERYLQWYSSFFEEAEPGQMLGEDSTTYISSSRGAERMRAINPNAKIIVLFRDPASRSYSHYWHLLRSGRAMFSFESSLQVMQETIVQRSLYLEASRRLLDQFPRDQVHFELFETMVSDTQATVRRVLDFVGAEQGKIDFDRSLGNYNPALLPLSPRVQRWRNTILRLKTREIYLDHLPEAPSSLASFTQKVLDRAHSMINPLIEKRPPPMKAATRAFLNDYFKRENAGLSELIGHDTEELWYRDQG